MRVLITGASGYLGSALVHALLETEHEPVVMVRHRERLNPDWRLTERQVLECDITTKRAVDLVQRSRADVLVHTVSLDHTRSEVAAQALRTNILPLMRMTRLTRSNGAPQRAIYFSTQQVYGRLEPGETVTEDREARPMNGYGWTHLACETLLRKWERTEGVQGASLRISNGYGVPVSSSAGCWQLAIQDFCVQAVRQGRIVLKSDGSPQRDFVHISDVTRAVRAVIEADSPPSTINIGSGETVTILEAARIVAEVYESVYGHRIGIERPNQSAPPTGANPSRFRYDVSRMNDLIGPIRTSMRTGIAELLQYIATGSCQPARRSDA